MEEINKYIASIKCYKHGEKKTLSEGVGVVVGDMLITAGHVIDCAEEICVYLDGHSYNLKRSEALFFESMDDDDKNVTHNDVAIFKIDGVNSPLVLSKILPEDSTTYMNAYFVKKTILSDDENIPLMFRQSEEVSIEQSRSLFKSIKEGNFFSCETEKILKEGNSGCPLFKGNVVYGILHGGVPGEHKCVYQSAKSILKLIQR